MTVSGIFLELLASLAMIQAHCIFKHFVFVNVFEDHKSHTHPISLYWFIDVKVE